jgi:hypothetical protein
MLDFSENSFYKVFIFEQNCITSFFAFFFSFSELICFLEDTLSTGFDDFRDIFDLIQFTLFAIDLLNGERIIISSSLQNYISQFFILGLISVDDVKKLKDSSSGIKGHSASNQ